MRILALGDFSGRCFLPVRRALEQAATSVEYCADTPAFHRAFEQGGAHCVVVDSLELIKAFAPELRESRAGLALPLFAIIERVNLRELLTLHGAGVDDVVTLDDVEGLQRRLRVVSKVERSSVRPPQFSGTCLVAHASLHRQRLLTRVLEQAGFQVLCASDTAEALNVVRTTPPTVAVVSSALPPEGGRRALRRVAASSLPSVLLTGGTPGAYSPQGWVVVSEDGSPDELLFVVNDLLHPPDLTGRRASRRLLYSTLCLFREEGQPIARAGLTYNISREGLYVRTFDAPPMGSQVWLELSPPGQNRFVHIRGKVAWVRLPSAQGRSAPAGFGVMLNPEGSPADDQAMLLTQYDWLAGMVAATEH
jgi:DNA-binding response OmpR family regulator/Tfp pilus assembly protein PilZ